MNNISNNIITFRHNSVLQYARYIILWNITYAEKSENIEEKNFYDFWNYIINLHSFGRCCVLHALRQAENDGLY